MKKFFRCEICGRDYESEQEALDCENKGTFDESKIPTGYVFELMHNGFVGIFAIKCGNVYSGNRHLGTITAWACRTEKYFSDSLDDEGCDINYLGYSTDEALENWREYYHMTEWGMNTPEYKRMIDYLKSKNITPIIEIRERKKDNN